MKQIHSLSLVIAQFGALLFPYKSFAQGVPIGGGVYACDGAAQAGPCQPEGVDETSEHAQSAPAARWADRWGAIADDDNGVAGIVADMPSKRAAQAAAIASCVDRGGKGCEVRMAYYNQCAAVATSAKGTIFFHAETTEEAVGNAMSNCEAKQGTGECRLYYSGCSLPVRVQ